MAHPRTRDLKQLLLDIVYMCVQYLRVLRRMYECMTYVMYVRSAVRLYTRYRYRLFTLVIVCVLHVWPTPALISCVCADDAVSSFQATVCFQRLAGRSSWGSQRLMLSKMPLSAAQISSG